MTMPTGPDARELRLRASLLAHYELPWLGVDHEDGVLFPESRRVGVEPGVRRWCLDDSVRRSAVAGVRPKELRRVWSALVKRPDDPRQWAIDRFIGQNEGVSLEELDVDRVRAIGWLSRWLDLRHLPDQHSIDRALGMAALLEPLRAIADHTFVGRQDVLALLDDQLRQPGRPLLIHGMGGVGKSAVLARHLLAHVDDALVCYLNFDNSALDPAAPVSLVSAIAKQLVPQLPASDEISALVRSGADRLRSDTKLLDTSTRSITLRRNAQRYLQELSDVLPDRPRIFVFDTLEEVQRRSPAVQEAFAEFIESLAQHVTILLAGRSPAPAFGFASVELSVLPSEDAITLLRSLVDVPVAEAREVIQLIRVTPLCVRMAAGILRKHPTNNAFRDLALRRTAIEGELYHRLLGYIKDPDVRSLAHPGLTLRRVTPALIEQVLAKPCRITVPDGERAHHLFEELAREAMLVERLPSRDEVVHRADVRSIMLPRLAEDDPATIKSIHRRARDFYKQRQDTTDRAEELYHRLMLGESPTTLDRRWDDRVLPHLVSSLDELPAPSKAYLAAKSPDLAIAEEDLQQAELHVRSTLILRRVREFAASRKLPLALNSLDEHDQVVGATSASTDLRIQVLELLGEREAALDVAATAQDTAARTGDTEEFFRLTAHILRLCELSSRIDDADTVATDALRIAVSLPPTVPYLQRQLQLVVQRLRFARRGSPVSDATIGQLRHQAIRLHQRLGVRRVKDVPGLLRELGAEVGPHSLRVLADALRSEGIDPRDATEIHSYLLQGPRPPEHLLQGFRTTADRYVLGALAAQVIAWYGNEMPSGISGVLAELLQQEADDAVAGGTDSDYTEESVELPTVSTSGLGVALAVAGVAAATTGDIERATALLRRALSTELDAKTRARVLVTLSGVVSDAAEVRSLLSEAAAIAPNGVSPIFLEAQMAIRSGGTETALILYDDAVATIEGDPAALSSDLLEDVLLDRGNVLILLGRLADAETDCRRVLELAGDSDELRTAKAHQLLGRVAARRSDLPTALAHYRRASSHPSAKVELAETLLAAGLAAEAADVLDGLMFDLRDARTGEDLAIAEHRAAVASFLLGDFAAAAELARSANRRFTRRDQHRLAAISALTRMRAQLAMEKPPAAAQATQLATRLRELGLPDEAAVATALAVRISVRLGNLESAATQVEALPITDQRSPIECRMAMLLCRAELAAARGDHIGVLTEAAQGYEELAKHHDGLGTLDLPTGTAVEGLALANLAVTAAWRSGTPRVFTWLEQAKADIYRYDPLPATRVVIELRTAARRRQQARLEGRSADTRPDRRRDLPSTFSVRTRWELSARLGDRALVSFSIVDMRYVALVLTSESETRVTLGAAGTIARVAHDLRTGLRSEGPDRALPMYSKAAGVSAMRTAEQMDQLLLEPITQLIGDKPLVVVPAGDICDLAWGVLPSLRGRPMTVAPSASAWLRACGSAPSSGRAVFVSAEGYTHLHSLRNAVHLNGDKVTAAVVLSAIRGASLVHLTARETGGDGNSWFAAAELADGLLEVSAIRASSLYHPPGLVVLDTNGLHPGRSTVGSDAFGFAGALLNAGVGTVVTTASPVSDLSYRLVMNAFYRSVLAGETAARALASATAEDPLRMPFICLGSGGAVDLL